MHFTGLVLVPGRSSCQYIYNWGLPAIDFLSFLIPLLTWMSHSSLITFHWSSTLGHCCLISFPPLCSCPRAPKDLSLGPSQTQVPSLLILATSFSNLQATPDFYLLLTGFLQCMPPPWTSPALCCVTLSCLCLVIFFLLQLCKRGKLLHSCLASQLRHK